MSFVLIDDAKVRRFWPDSKEMSGFFSDLLRQGGNETTKGGLRAKSCREDQPWGQAPGACGIILAVGTDSD